MGANESNGKKQCQASHESTEMGHVRSGHRRGLG